MASVLGFFQNARSRLLGRREEKIDLQSFMRLSETLFGLNFIRFSPISPYASTPLKFGNFVRNFYNRLALMVHFWTIISKFILMMQSESFMAAAPFILDVLTYFLNIFKVWHFLFRKDEIWKIYEELEAVFDHPGDQWRDYGMKTYLDNYYRIMIIYAAPTIMILVVASLPIIPYLLFGKMDLLVEYWYPFDPMQPETFLFAYAFVVWVGINALITMLATDALLYCMVTVVAMEFNIFKIDLMSGLAASNSLGSRGFKALIDRHKRLMDISDRLERTYSESFLCSFVISSLVMCFVAFQLSRSSDRFDYYAYYFTYFWMMSAQILLLCLFGQKLIDSSQSVADGVYDCGWEGIEDEALKKQLVIIILRAQKGKRLTAMNFAEISLETFTSILTATHSYFSLLTSVDKRLRSV